MTEYTFKSADGDGDVAIVNAETVKEALSMLKPHYRNCKFELLDSYCLDCEE